MFLHVFHTSFTRLSHVFHVFHRFMCMSALIAPPPPVQHAFIVIASLIWFSTYFGTSFTSFIRFCLYLQARNVKFHVFQMFLHVLTCLAHIFFLVFHTLMCSSALLGRTPPVLPPLGQNIHVHGFHLYICLYYGILISQLLALILGTGWCEKKAPSPPSAKLK